MANAQRTFGYVNLYMFKNDKVHARMATGSKMLAYVALNGDTKIYLGDVESATRLYEAAKEALQIVKEESAKGR
jgi:hypothetical protein